MITVLVGIPTEYTVYRYVRVWRGLRCARRTTCLLGNVGVHPEYKENYVM